MNDKIEILNFTVDLEELRRVYKEISQSDLKWTFSEQRNQLHPITVEKYNGFDYEGLPYGWALTSPYDSDVPTAPWAITNFAPGTSKRPTKFIQGLIKKIFDTIPASAFEFSITVHPPGSEIVKHSDGDNTLRIHIPIWNVTHFIIDDNGEVEHTMYPNGSAYLVDARYQHRTINPTTEDRVSLIIGIPVDAEDAVKAITGLISV
jgi:hypothetical protein